MITTFEIEQMIATKLPGSKIEVSDMTGGGDHFEISVVSKEFAGKSIMEQHQVLYAILGAEMDRRIHAVKLKTRVA